MSMQKDFVRSHRFSLLVIIITTMLQACGSSGSGAVDDDDAGSTQPVFTIEDSVVVEGDDGMSTLTFSVASSHDVEEGGATVDYQVMGNTASEGIDYIAVSGTLNFAQGESVNIISVDVLSDRIDEFDELVFVTLNNPVNAGISRGQGEGVIVDDDEPPTISIADASLTEGDSGSSNLAFSVTLSAASGKTITLDYATSADTAMAGVDFTATSSELTFAPGETIKTVNVAVLGDTLNEGDERFYLNLSNPANVTIVDGQGEGLIADNESFPSVSIADAILTEGDTGTANLSFNVELSAVSGQVITMSYATSDGSAVAGEDYTSTSGTLTFLAGESQKTIEVPIIGDSLDENDEGFSVTLSSAVNVNLLDGTASGGITDNDLAPTVSVNDVTITEGDSGSSNLAFSVTLSAASGKTITLDYATSADTATAGVDFTATSSSQLTFAPGETSKTVNVPVLGDTLQEPDEAFNLSLSALNNATLNEGVGVGTILDNDSASPQTGLDQRPNNTTCLAPDRPSENTSLSTIDAFSALPSFVLPIAMQQAPGDDSQWFVIEKQGLVVAFDNSPSVSSRRTVLNITSIVDSGPNEAGLLGMAFHPNFQVNGEVFLSYTRSGSPLVSYISRFTSGDNGVTLDASSEEVILTVAQDFENHNGGHISFGPDGFLYIGLGDGGGAEDPFNRSQDTTNLLGSMLRIDVDGGNPYAIPSDNPFVGNPICSSGTGSSACPEIYAWGLRNPWRWNFDRDTRLLWLADVGQYAWEEVNIIERGGNYGWRIREGAHCFNPSSGCQTSSLIDPVAEYDHSQGFSITGGYVYRGTTISELIGSYLFGDFGTGRIWALDSDGMGGFLLNEQANTELGIASFAEGNDGELYILDYWSGRIHRLIRASAGGADTIPALLSQTGCVDSGDPTQAASGMIPFDTNVALWADGAEKQRWLGLPNGETISINAEDDWVFPNGTVLLKHFILNSKFIETRLLMRHTDGSWAGYTYEWDDAETEATRVRGGKSKVIDSVNWVYPSESQCMMCHTVAAGFSLGPETGQLNKDFTYPSTGRTDNQLHTLDSIIAFDLPLPDLPDNLVNYPDPFDTAEALANRARAYLRTHCSQCHRPGGPTPSSMDLRYQTSFAATNTCNAIPSGGNLGISGARLIVPGDASRSIIPNRMTRRDVHGMPPLGTSIIDTAGVAVISDWINSLSSCP